MTFWPRFALLLALCTGVTAATLAGASWLWELMPFAEINRACILEERLDRASAVVVARAEFKGALMRGLTEGRLTLAEAVARLGDYLQSEAPRPPGELSGLDLLRTVPGDSDPERCGRNLIQLAKVYLRSRPGTRETLARLGAELREIVRAEERGGE